MLICLMLQTYVRTVPGHMLPKDFDASGAYASDGAHVKLPTGQINNAEMWTALVLAYVEFDILCHCYEKRTVRLAYVMWLDQHPNDPCSALDTLQNTDRVHGYASDVPTYDFIEIDRILGPEFLVPSFGKADITQFLERDFRMDPVRVGEPMRRIVVARRVGMPHATFALKEEENTNLEEENTNLQEDS